MRRKVLDDLPLWFGLPESNNEYCEAVKKYCFICISADEKEIGFVSIKENNKYVYELYVLGIMEAYHRKGIGKKVLNYIPKFSAKL
jgi:ribosomal protein S18 acetylase RimI-like enzyme